MEHTGVEDHLLVGREFARNGLPEGLEVSCRGDDIPGAERVSDCIQVQIKNILAAVVVRVEDRIGTAIRDGLDDLLQVLQICGIQAARHVVRDESLHEEWHPEDIHALLAQSLDLRSVGESIVGSRSARDVRLAKFGARLVDTHPWTVSIHCY